MSNSSTVQERNRQLAEAINRETLANPNSPYAGKFVGIAHGQVVAVSDDFDQLMRALCEVEPDPENRFFIEAGRDYDEPQDIWSIT
jgi:hypothetical protein